MMLAYNLPSPRGIYQRFVGLEGSAYFVGGFGMTALTIDNIVVVPIRSGVGFRLGANLGYTPIPSVTEEWLARAGGSDSCCGHDSRRLS
jgi:hypothetical protein